MLPEKKCTGCGACMSICKRSCITMKQDQEGFIYPVIDSELCVNCCLCEKVCPVINKIEMKTNDVPVAFAGKIIDDDIRLSSSSGGIFTAFAKHIIKNNGIVFGAAFADGFLVKHIGVFDQDDLKWMRGSKYVQSQIGDSFIVAENELKKGRLVLFSGTPCQIAGLLSYLRKPYKNLITVDLICHGVPSVRVWSEYLSWQRRENKKEIVSVEFRNKTNGWKNYSQKIDFDDGTSYLRYIWDDFYMKAFLSNLSLRPSCYNCDFKTVNRQSDLTLADLWGIDDIISDKDDDKGMSLIVAHSTMGAKMLEAVRNDIFLCQIDFEKAVAHNISMIESVREHQFRQYFFATLGKKDFGKLVQECIEPTFYSRIMRKYLQWKK